MYGESLNLDEITKSIEQDGICCIPDFISEHDTNLIREEGLRLNDKFSPLFGETSPIKIMGGWRLGLPPMAIARRGGGPLSRTISKIAGSPFFKNLCDRVYGADWHLEVIVFDYREPTDEPMPDDSEYVDGYPPAVFWHSDYVLPGMQDTDLFSLRFQIYLNDTKLENGAFSYVDGSHKLVKYLRQRSLESEQGPIPLGTYNQIVDAAEECLQSPEGLPDAMVASYRDVLEKAKSWKHVSEDVVAMKAGSLFIFDDVGIHRVSPITVDHRYIVRFQFLKTPPKRDSLKTAIGRKYLRARIKEPLAELL